jgi:hypothetical protein
LHLATKKKKKKKIESLIHNSNIPIRIKNIE